MDDQSDDQVRPVDPARRGQVAESTREAERADSEAGHAPDRMPSDEEEAIAERFPLEGSTAEHYRDMTEKGANAKGEGRVP